MAVLGGGRIEGEVAVNTVPPVETAELRFGAGLGDGLVVVPAVAVRFFVLP